MNVNGYDLSPGAFQITMEYTSKQSKDKVIYNAPSYGRAMAEFEQLVDDPRIHLNRVAKLEFQVLDHQGNVVRAAPFEYSRFLYGEELAQREIAWSFGYSESEDHSFWLTAFVWSVILVYRVTYHAACLAFYALMVAGVIGMPLAFLVVAWSYITSLLDR